VRFFLNRDSRTANDELPGNLPQTILRHRIQHRVVLPDGRRAGNDDIRMRRLAPLDDFR
jgi:hypothetical protein